MNGVRFVLDVGGEDILDFITKHSTTRQDPKRSQYQEYSTWPVKKKLALRFNVTVFGHSPPSSTSCPHHVISIPRFSLFSATLLFCILYWTQTEEQKRKTWEYLLHDVDMRWTMGECPKTFTLNHWSSQVLSIAWNCLVSLTRSLFCMAVCHCSYRSTNKPWTPQNMRQRMHEQSISHMSLLKNMVIQSWVAYCAGFILANARSCWLCWGGWPGDEEHYQVAGVSSGSSISKVASLYSGLLVSRKYILHVTHFGPIRLYLTPPCTQNHFRADRPFFLMCQLCLTLFVVSLGGFGGHRYSNRFSIEISL